MAMVWPVPSSARTVDAVGGADLGRRVGDRPGGRTQASRRWRSPLPLIVSVSTIERAFELGVSALGELCRRCVDRAGDPRMALPLKVRALVLSRSGRSDPGIRPGGGRGQADRPIAAQGDAAVSAAVLLLGALKIITPVPLTLRVAGDREAAALDDVDAGVHRQLGVARDA